MPKRDYGPGEGVYETAICTVPRTLWFPRLKWLEVGNSRDVITRVPMTKNAQLEDVDAHAVGINTPTNHHDQKGAANARW